MRAAVDYCNYVDNYFTSRFISLDAKLVYLVHSSSGITRNPVSRCNQLAMHDYAMHRLWSSFADCTLSDISAIRSIVVSKEHPQVNIERYRKKETEQLIEMLFPGESVEYSYSTLSGRVLVPGESILRIQFYDLGQAERVDSILRVNNFRYKITYCSVYDDSWSSNGLNVVEED